MDSCSVVLATNSLDYLLYPGNILARHSHASLMLKQGAYPRIVKRLPLPALTRHSPSSIMDMKIRTGRSLEQVL